MAIFKLPKALSDILIKIGLLKPAPIAVVEQSADSDLCCEGRVHIFYRGVSDDRLYKAADRHWNELKFFRQNGLKVYCRHCRRRLY